MGICYVNGRYLPAADAMVPMEDRGHQFADGVYEVIAFFNRTLVDGEGHLQRLSRSLAELEIAPPVDERALTVILCEMMTRNRYTHGSIYLQITRGHSRRDHIFPSEPLSSLTLSVAPQKTPSKAMVERGVKVITQPDLRWKRCDIKTISLLPNLLAKQKAKEASAREAWLITEAGFVTEGAVSNAFIVKDKAIITHPSTNAILGGITRETTLQLARERQISVEERPFTLDEAKAADEAFLTSTTSNVLPIVTIDTDTVGSGAPGPVTRQLIEAYHDHIREQTGYAA